MLESCDLAPLGAASRYRPEIEGGVTLLYFLSTYGRTRATPGMLTMDLSLRARSGGGAKDGAAGAGAGMAVPAMVLLLVYAFRRLELSSQENDWATDPDPLSWRRRCASYVKILRASFHIIGVANTLLFLWDGVFVSLFHRTVGLEMGHYHDNSSSSSSGSGSGSGTRPVYSNAQQMLKSRKIGWLALVQLATSLVYVTSSAQAQRLSTSISVGADASTGTDWTYVGMRSYSASRRWFQNSWRACRSMASHSYALFVRFRGGVGASDPPRNTQESSPRPDPHPPLVEDDVGRVGATTAAAVITCLCFQSKAETPRKASCGHVFCYLCLHGVQQQNELWRLDQVALRESGGSPLVPVLCPVCDEVVQ